MSRFAPPGRPPKIPLLVIGVLVFASSFILTACDSDSVGEKPVVDCLAELAELETSIRGRLDAYPADTDFTLLLQAGDGKTFEHSVGVATAETSYRSASTSKWVTAAVLLLLVDEGFMTLADNPQDYLDFWPESGWVAEIELAHLLNFTSGLIEMPLCTNLPNSDFAGCVETILDQNLDQSQSPGAEFYYGGAHMQVAGLMAVEAFGANTWATVFDHFRIMTGLFPNSAYDLPSASNPRLAGGMHWIALDYMDFLQAIADESLLSSELLDLMLGDRIVDAPIAYSPAWEGIGEDWHYGYGCWIECHSAQFDCTVPTRISSPGAYGAYPFIDLEHGYFGILAREGALDSYALGYQLFTTVSEDLEEWAGISCD